MALNIEIGQASLDWSTTGCVIRAQHEERYDTGGGNNCEVTDRFLDGFKDALDIGGIWYPSTFCEQHAIVPLDYGDRVVPLTELHYEYLNNKLKQYRKNPSAKSGFLSLADWLVFWICSALDNCTMPVFVCFRP